MLDIYSAVRAVKVIETKIIQWSNIKRKGLVTYRMNNPNLDLRTALANANIKSQFLYSLVNTNNIFLFNETHLHCETARMFRDKNHQFIGNAGVKTLIFKA